MVTPKRLSKNSRLTFVAFFQVMRVVVEYRKGRKYLKKKFFYTQKLPWPHHLSATEHSLGGSRLFLQTTQWASGSPVFFLCSTWYMVFGAVDRGKGNLLFDNFRQQIHHKFRSPSTHTSKSTARHIAETVLHIMWYPLHWGVLNAQ